MEKIHFTTITKNQQNHEKDLVRKYWEQELIQFTMRPILRKFLQNPVNTKGLRILEFGVGAVPGYHLLSHIYQHPEQTGLKRTALLSEKDVALFMGLATEYEQVESNNEQYRLEKKVRFIRHNYAQGLGIIGKAEPPFDIYFSKYAVLSKLSPSQLSNLLSETCTHAKLGSVIVLDLNSRQTGLVHDSERYYWEEAQLLKIIKEVSESTGISLKILNKVDRCIFTPLKRKYLNQLFQKDTRTDLQKLKIQEDQRRATHKNSTLEDSYEQLLGSWNLFLEYATQRLEKDISYKDIQNWESLPSSLQFGLMTLDRLCSDTDWIAYGDRRANILEPHIAYVLRSLEYELQQGLGLGAELCYVLEVV